MMDLDPTRVWVMPDWLREYNEVFNNTGGNEVEDLVNRYISESNLVFTNLPMYTLAAMAFSQVNLMYALRDRGLLKPLGKENGN